MKNNIVRDGRGMVIGFIREDDDGNRFAADERGEVLGRYSATCDWTIEFETGTVMGKGDHTMRLLGDD